MISILRSTRRQKSTELVDKEVPAVDMMNSDLDISCHQSQKGKVCHSPDLHMIASFGNLWKSVRSRHKRIATSCVCASCNVYKDEVESVSRLPLFEFAMPSNIRKNFVNTTEPCP